MPYVFGKFLADFQEDIVEIQGLLADGDVKRFGRQDREQDSQTPKLRKMKSIVILATVFCAALVSSYPLPEGDRLQSEVSGFGKSTKNKLNSGFNSPQATREAILQSSAKPLDNLRIRSCTSLSLVVHHGHREKCFQALNRLVMIEADNETALRSKRTIGILRELFPEASQMIEKKVNAIVAQFIRVLGPTLLQGALGNSGSSSDSDSGATAASSSNDDDDDDFNSTSSDGSKVSISLPTYPPDVENVAETLVSTSTEDNVTTTGGGQDRTTDMVNTVV
ncbi:hypothetical protein WN48_00557 [Eufriesea mexicana]|nr:hypothetical protein WN48_00557 [Eufriesea mexicana]